MRRGYLLVVILLSSCFFSVPNVKAAQVSIPAGADAYVDNSSRDVNRGTSAFLYVYNYQFEIFNMSYTIMYDTYLKFDLSEVPSGGEIVSAALVMHTGLMRNPYVNNTVGVFLCDDSSWSESDITWSNAPFLSNSTPVRILNVTTSFRDYVFELSSALKGKMAVTLILKTLEPVEKYGWAAFYSREGDSGPTLLVDYVVGSKPFDVVPVAVCGVAIVFVALEAWVYFFQVRRKRSVESHLGRRFDLAFDD